MKQINRALAYCALNLLTFILGMIVMVVLATEESPSTGWATALIFILLAVSVRLAWEGDE